MIEKLVAFCESFDERLKAVEATQNEMAKAISEVRNVLAEPSGFITTRGVVQKGTEEIKDLLKHPVQTSLEEARIELQFTQAFYLTANPNLKDKLHEFLSENELATLLQTVKTYEKAESLLGDAERRQEEAVRKFTETREELIRRVELATQQSTRKAVERIERTLNSLVVQKDFVEEAKAKLTEALGKCEAFMAKHGNVLKSQAPVKRGIYSP